MKGIGEKRAEEGAPPGEAYFRKMPAFFRKFSKNGRRLNEHHSGKGVRQLKKPVLGGRVPVVFKDPCMEKSQGGNLGREVNEVAPDGRSAPCRRRKRGRIEDQEVYLGEGGTHVTKRGGDQD